MKKLLFLSTMLSLSLISCGDDDQNNQDQDPLIGKWNIVKSEIYENGTLTDSENLKPGSCDYNYYELKTGGVKMRFITTNKIIVLLKIMKVFGHTIVQTNKLH